MSTQDIILIVLFFLCLAASAFFSAAEIAFMALQRFRLEHMLETHVKGAEEVAALVKHPERLLSTVLLGNDFVNTAAASIGTVLAVDFWGRSGTIASIFGVTVILLIFSETIPKTTAARHTETLSIRLARSVRAISWLFNPVVTILSWMATSFGKVLGAQTVGRSLVSEEEIRTMIDVGSKEGTVEFTEAQMLHKVFEFGDRPAREIMVPRTEVIWVEKGSKIEDFLKLYLEHPLNRYPVFEEKRDNVIGVLSTKDIMLALAKGTCDVKRTIDELIRPAYFAPESKLINEMLTEMQDNGYHMCIIVDEYGGVAGIITLTAIVEEIVGDVRDELSTVNKDFEVIDEYTFQVDGGMRIDEVNEEMRLELPEGDYETVAGLILKLLGHIPKTGEQIKYRNLKIVVTRMEGLKIEEVLITKEKHAATTDKV